MSPSTRNFNIISFDDEIDIKEFFEYISTDTRGEIGENFNQYIRQIRALIEMSPDDITNEYIDYINSLSENDDLNGYHFLNDYTRGDNINEHTMKFKNCFELIFNAIDRNRNDILDNRRPEFIFVMNLWMFIWH